MPKRKSTAKERKAAFSKRRKSNSFAMAMSGDLSSNRRRKIVSSAEKKVLDVAENTDITTTATITLLNGMQRGDTISTRDGRKIMISSIFLRSHQFNESNVAIGTPRVTRTMIVYDKQPSGAAPVIGDILQGGANITAFNNLDNRERFVVLMDEVHKIKPDGFAGDGATNLITPGSAYFTRFMKTKLDVTYNSGNVGDVTDISSGALFLVQFSTAAAGTNDVDNNTRVRVRFVDY